MTRSTRPFAAGHPLERNFFLGFLVVAVIAVAGGFLPKLATIFSGERAWPPFSVHVHAVLFYGWIAFLAAQVLLIRTGNTSLHKRFGLFGLGLAAAMVVVGGWMALTMAGWHLQQGSDRALGFLPVPLLDLVVFTVLISAAGLMRRDSAAHKRLILLGTTELLGAGFGRMNLYEMAPTPWLPPVEMFVNLYGMLWVIMAVAILFDVLTRGRPHRVYLVAVPFMLAMQYLAATLVAWPGWKPLAASALGLG